LIEQTKEEEEEEEVEDIKKNYYGIIEIESRLASKALLCGKSKPY